MKNKECSVCHEPKSSADFYVARVSEKGVVYYSSYCKGCQKIAIRKAQVRRRARNQQLVFDWYEEQGGCTDCGEMNPIKLSCDHIGPKADDVGNLVISGSLKRIKAELQHCVPRCHNCHAVKTAATRNFYATESLRDYVTQWLDNRAAYDEAE